MEYDTPWATLNLIGGSDEKQAQLCRFFDRVIYIKFKGYVQSSFFRIENFAPSDGQTVEYFPRILLSFLRINAIKNEDLITLLFGHPEGWHYEGPRIVTHGHTPDEISESARTIRNTYLNERLLSVNFRNAVFKFFKQCSIDHIERKLYAENLMAFHREIKRLEQAEPLNEG